MFSLECHLKNHLGTKFQWYQIDTAGNEDVVSLVNTLNQRVQEVDSVDSNSKLFMCTNKKRDLAMLIQSKCDAYEVLSNKQNRNQINRKSARKVSGTDNLHGNSVQKTISPSF